MQYKFFFFELLILPQAGTEWSMYKSIIALLDPQKIANLNMDQIFQSIVGYHGDWWIISLHQDIEGKHQEI